MSIQFSGALGTVLPRRPVGPAQPLPDTKVGNQPVPAAMALELFSPPTFFMAKASTLLFGETRPRIRKSTETPLHPEVAAYQTYVRQIHPNITQLSAQQSQAIQHLSEGNSPLCNLPTGSGKTLIAEYPIFKVLQHNQAYPDKPVQRVVYTLPRKAALNEKFENFVKRYGEENVGIMTGDVTINRNAPVLLMTAEVWTNILARQAESDPLLQSVRYAVHDEFHFISDKDRGTTWEEAVLLTPNRVQQLFLSASVSNAEEMVDWLNTVRTSRQKTEGVEANSPYFPNARAGRVTLVQSHHRAVPLRYAFIGYNREGKHALVEMFQNDGREADYYRELHEQVARLESRIEALMEEREPLIASHKAYVQSHWTGADRKLEYEIEQQQRKQARLKERINTIEEANAITAYVKAYDAHKVQEAQVQLVYQRLTEAGVKVIAEHPDYKAAKHGESSAAGRLRALRRSLRNQGFRIPKAREIVDRQKSAEARVARFMKDDGVPLDANHVKDLQAEQHGRSFLLGSLYTQFRRRMGQLKVAWRRETREKMAAEGKVFREVGHYNDEIGQLRRQHESASNRLIQYDRRDLQYKREIVENSLRQIEEALDMLEETIGDRPDGQPTVQDLREQRRLHKSRKSLMETLARTEAQTREINHKPPFNSGFRESFSITGKQLQTGQVALVDPVLAVKALQSKNALGRNFSLMPALFVVFSQRKTFDMAQKVAAQLPEVLAPGRFPSAQKAEVPETELKALITPEERAQIDAVIGEFTGYYKGLSLERRRKEKDSLPDAPKQRVTLESPILPLLRKGVAIHHAGLTPDEKKLVETLVDKGLMKAVFATDTMTVALDAPFQSVVLTSFERAGELIENRVLQQAGGRAGRLGKHKEGFFFLPYPRTFAEKTERDKLAALVDKLTAPPEALTSQLDVSTFQVLNLLDRHTPETVETLIRQSLGVYQAAKNPETANVPLVGEADQLNPGEAFIDAFRKRRQQLTETGFLEVDGRLSAMGQLARHIPGENHLLIAQALQAGLLQTLPPEQLALTISMIAAESRNLSNPPINPLVSDQWAPPKELVPAETMAVVKGLRALYQGLGQVSEDAFINPEYASVIVHWLTYHDYALIQQHERRGDVFDVIRRSENLLRHLDEIVDSLEMTDVERETFRNSVQTAKGMLATRQIKKMAAPMMSPRKKP